ncbi:MAG: hypothetical protein ABR530_11295 [Pyrinomonadaceae bacterium]
MKKAALLMSLAVIAALSHNLYRSEAAKPSGNTPATSTIGDADPVSGTVYRVGSDSLGTYRNGVDSVESIVQGIGNWELDTKPSPLRRVRVDLGDPVPGSGANPPFQAAVVPLRFISKCTTSIFTLALNQSILCPLAIGAIEYDGAIYALRSQQTNYPGTEPVIWTCLARNSTKCISWTMVPSAVQADGQRKIVMQLLKPGLKPHDPDVLLGRFYISFDIGVTTP